MPQHGPNVEGSHWVPSNEPLLPVADVKLAGYLPRLLAYLVDVFLLSFVLYVAIVAFPRSRDGSDRGLQTVITLGVVSLFLLYFPFCWARGGQTIGMRIFRLRVVREPDAAPIGWKTALLRLLGTAVNGFVLYLGWLWIFVDKRRRGWHDLIAKTVVVDDRSLHEFRSGRSVSSS